MLHSGATGYGFLMAASGLGSLLAALALAFGGAARPACIGIGAMILGVSEVVLGGPRSSPLSMVLMFAVGFGAILMAATVNTTIQLAVPDALRGRVMSVYTTVFAGSTPIGGPVMGGVASLFGIAISLAVGGILSLAVGGGALAWLRRSGRDRIPRRASSARRRRPSRRRPDRRLRGRAPGAVRPR